MHLLVLQGLPGVGKLTVGKVLAHKTGYKLFHNHISIDAISSLFDTSFPGFWRLSRELRLKLLEEAAAYNIPGVIVTYCYMKPAGDLFVKPLLEIVKKYHSTIDFVYLTCSEQEQYKRVESPSRQGTTKLHSKEELIKAQEEHNFSIIPYVDSYIIDTTKLSPEKVADMIIEKYALPTVRSLDESG